MIQFDVIDNGRGMDAELLHYVWADGFSTRGSSGLGLNFVQQVVQNNNGTVEIKSTPGEGTVVTIQLPESGVEG